MKHSQLTTETPNLSFSSGGRTFWRPLGRIVQGVAIPPNPPVCSSFPLLLLSHCFRLMASFSVIARYRSTSSRRR